MKRINRYISVFMAISFLLTFALEARGRGGGGGRSFSGGRGGGGRSMNRSPSLSRSSRPSPKISQRPSTGRPQTSRPTRPTQRPSMDRRPQANTPSRNQVRDFINNQPSKRPAGRPSTLPETRPSRPSRPDAGRPGRPDRPDGGRPGRPDRPKRSGDVRDRIKENHPKRGDWFDNDFWKDHNRPHPPYYRPGENWWKWATVGGVASWLTWRSQPIYYGYYDEGYWGSYDYTESIPSDYYQQSQQIETAAEQPLSDEWMPLGVFAISKDKGATVTPNMYMQLAINKEGLISGTLYNTTTNQAYELEGLADESSQIAAWKMSDSENSPIIDTGIYNLTEDETPARITFEDGRKQEILLIRLSE